MEDLIRFVHDDASVSVEPQVTFQRAPRTRCRQERAARMDAVIALRQGSLQMGIGTGPFGRFAAEDEPRWTPSEHELEAARRLEPARQVATLGRRKASLL